MSSFSCCCRFLSLIKQCSAALDFLWLESDDDASAASFLHDNVADVEFAGFYGFIFHAENIQISAGVHPYTKHSLGFLLATLSF